MESSLVGRTLGHYRINAVLGAGGMGEVYRATDTKLARDIALKVLPPAMASDPDRLVRFQREARAVAALNHPNVITVYSVEESDNVHFITMELIEGQPLDRLICPNGLPAGQIIEIAGAIAEALAAAHDKGIVHRDLKPANVMVSSEGRIKVLDFGLAKDVGAENSNDATLTSIGRTRAGVVMGTPAYMSPEQVSGRPLDHRTDIFSLGVLLHEMAAGCRPFDGVSSAELISSILRDTPPSVNQLRPDLPADLARVIRRCLEKDPRYRMQTARDISNEFRDMARTMTHHTPLSSSPAHTSVPPSSGSTRADEGFWVAVLPFRYSGSNADLGALVDALSEDVITGLSRFSYLKVIARSSTARYAGQSVDVRNAGKELNARYVMEGTLRQAGSKLRLAVQLVDTISGAHLWAENYERSFTPEAVFELQDDLVPRIVSTVADMNGVLPRSMSEGLLSRSPEQLTPYEAVLRSFAYCSCATPQDLAAARSGLEAAVRKAPAYSDAWAMLSFLCGQDFIHGYELQANALEVAASAARRAVALGPSNHVAYFSLAQALWSQKDFGSFRDAAERAVALNPMDGNSVAFLGELLLYAGNEERGMQLAERAKQLNPNHPGWYWYADFYHAFSQGDYRGALSFAHKVKVLGNPLAPMFIAAACGQLGEDDLGAKAVADLLKFRPELPAIMRKQAAKVWNPEYGERFLNGLQKAGLEIGDKPGASAADAAPAKSIAVLPFVNVSADKADEYLSDGMTEELINALAKVPGLRVPGRTSCFAFKGKTETDIFRKVGDQLHVGTVLEGSVRKAGEKLRVTAQLINVSDGYHLWSKNYDGDMNDILNFQSNVAEQVVQALQVHLGAEAARALSKKPTENPEAHRLYLLGRYEFAKYTQAGWNNAIRYYEHALKLDPEYALAYCGLADNYAYMGSTVMPGKDANTKVKEFAEKALALDPELAEARMSLALALVAAYDWQSGLKEFDRALELNPNLAFAYELQAWTVNGLGRFDEAIAKTRKAVELDPLNPFFQMALSFFLYWARQYDDSIEQARKTLQMDPSSAISYVLLGLSFLKKGDTVGAIAEFQKAKAPNPGAWYQGYLGYAYATSGDRAKAEQSLRELEDLNQYVSPTAFATIYLGLGENEKCLDWLEKAYEQQDSACWYLEIDQIYDSVRNEPRFQALIQKVFREGN